MVMPPEQVPQLRHRGLQICEVRRSCKVLAWFVVLTMVIPSVLGAAIGYAKGWPASWRQANWASSGSLPDAATARAAKVLVLSSRTGRWKGIFADHMSIVMKQADESSWTRFDVVGWGKPVRENAYAADAFWYGNSPRVIYELDGDAAERLIPAIKAPFKIIPTVDREAILSGPARTRIPLCPGSCAIRMALRRSFRRSRWARIISAPDCSLPRAERFRLHRFPQRIFRRHAGACRGIGNSCGRQHHRC